MYEHEPVTESYTTNVMQKKEHPGVFRGQFDLQLNARPPSYTVIKRSNFPCMMCSVKFNFAKL